MKIALLGAESTGKTTLCHRLADALRARGHRVAVVEEVLREWCDRQGRTPRAEEQRGIAEEQERRVDAAAAQADVVVADTTSLMVAVYSVLLFDDESILDFALERLRRYDFVLLTGLDLPWVADGMMRDGPHVREPVDAMVRQALARCGVAYRIVYGSGAARLRAALAALGLSDEPQRQPAWKAQCERCSDPDCEHRLFARLLTPAVPPTNP